MLNFSYGESATQVETDKIYVVIGAFYNSVFSADEHLYIYNGSYLDIDSLNQNLSAAKKQFEPGKITFIFYIGDDLRFSCGLNSVEEYIQKCNEHKMLHVLDR